VATERFRLPKRKRLSQENENLPLSLHHNLKINRKDRKSGGIITLPGRGIKLSLGLVFGLDKQATIVLEDHIQ
jgi:hypothetical protein